MGERLDALLGFGEPDRSAPTGADGLKGSELREVAITSIVPNEFQPRASFDDEDLESLAASIEQVGVLQPVLVRRIDDDQYELIAGERRWRAAQRAGLRTIPAIVRIAGDRDSLEQAVVENLHRADLNPLEEAAAYRQLLEEFGLTQEEVAQRVGKSRSAVANLLRLFHLPSGIQRLIASGQLATGHARALLALSDPAQQEELAGRVILEGLSVRQVEQLVRSMIEDGPDDRADRSSGKPKSASLLEIERLLADRLDTRVEVTLGRGRGRVVVEFADAEDLDRIYRLLAE